MKGNKKAIIAIVAILMVVGVIAFTNETGGGFLEGTSILSISKIDLVGAPQNIYGDQAWLITTIEGEAGRDNLIATRQLIDDDNPDVKSDESVTIETTIEKQQCKWNFNTATREPIFELRKHTVSGYDCTSFGCKYPTDKTLEEWCDGFESATNEVIAEQVENHCTWLDGCFTPVHEGKRYCYTYHNVADIVKSTGGSVDTDIKVELKSSDGTTYSPVTVTENKRNAPITKGGKQVGLVSYDFLGWSGSDCDSLVVNSQIASLFVNGKWQPADYLTYQNHYVPVAPTGFRTDAHEDADACYRSYDNGFKTYQQTITCLNNVGNTLNGAVDIVTAPADLYIQKQNSNEKLKLIIGNANGATPYLYQNLKSWVGFPSLSMWLSTEEFPKVSVSQDISDPKITGADTTCFDSGDEGTVTVTVRNIGDARGDFQVYLDCGNQNIYSKSDTIENLAPGATDTAIIKVSGVTNSDSNEYRACTVYAEAKGASSTYKDDVGIQLCIKPYELCGGAKYRCSLDETNVVEVCSSGGYEYFKTCDAGESCANGVCVSGSVCGDKVCELGEKENCPSDCNGGGGFNNEIFSAMVGTLVGILIFSVIFSYRKQKKNKTAIALLGGLIAGVIVFLLISSLQLDIQDPFGGFIPSPEICTSSWGMFSFLDVWNYACIMGVYGYWLGYLFAVGLGGIAAWFLYSGMRGSTEFAKKPFMMISLSLITFVLVFMIGRIFAPLAILIAILYLIAKFLLPSLGGVAGMLR